MNIAANLIASSFDPVLMIVLMTVD